MGKRTGWLKRRSTLYGTQMGLVILIVLGILVGLEALSMNHNWRLDLTKNRRYSLATQTRKLLETLDAPIRAYAFYQEGDPARKAAEDVFDLYKYHSKHFDWEFVDPDRFPLKAEKYKVSTYNIIVLEQGDRFERAFSIEEERITNALLKLSRKEKRVIYCLQGHGEHGLDDVEREGYSQAKKAMEDENYEVKTLILARKGVVPDDADVVLVGGPQKVLYEEEQQALKTYLERGGNLLIMADPQHAPEMDAFLHPFGIVLGQDIVVDPDSRFLGGDYLLPPIVEYEPHPITRDFRQSPYLAYLPLARSVRPADESPEGVTVEVLARTGAGSWAEVDLDRVKRGEAELDPETDVDGPVPVAVVATVQPKGGGEQARIVVFGDSDFVSNRAIDPDRSANQDLFLNALNWLAEQEDLISIRVKSAASRPVILSPGQQTLIFVLVVVAFPLAILAIGVGVLWRRREKA
jgi:ABC-type uncharacterized transport system involved in gliding motility auxiliary subunit